MPTIRVSTSVPANGVVANVLSGSVFETLPVDAIAEFANNQQSAALGAVLATVLSGPDVLLEESPISINARVPLYPEDFDLFDAVNAGDKLIVKLRNTTAGAIIVVTAVRFSPA